MKLYFIKNWSGDYAARHAMTTSGPVADLLRAERVVLRAWEGR